MKILYCEQTIDKPTAEPLLSLLTDSSVSRNHKPLFVPPHHNSWTLTLGIAVKISRLGKFVASKFASRYYDSVTLVARLRPADLPLPASAVNIAFDSSIVVGDWLPLPDNDCDDISLDIELAGNNRSITVPRQLINDQVEWLTSYFMIKHGDIIVTGDLPGNLDVHLDTAFDIIVNHNQCLHFKIK